jgi:glycosyltransferase involved in cell wall biosynthesis
MGNEIQHFPTVSIVVPAYNEEKNIEECIKSLLTLDYQNKEIIIVDDHSTDRTADIVSKYPVILIRRSQRGGHAAARNDGIKAAKGEIIAFTDADCITDRAWLKNLIRNYDNPTVGGVGGVVLSKSQNLLAKYRTYREREEYEKHDISKTNVTNLPGGNASYRKEVLEKVGGFDPRFSAPIGQATLELGYRILRAGYKLVGETDAVVFHTYGGSAREWLITYFRGGYSSFSFLEQYGWTDFLMIRFKQLLFIVAMVSLVCSILILPSPYVTILLIAAFLLFDLIIATKHVLETAIELKSLGYFLLLPVEILLVLSVQAGFMYGIIKSVARKLL